MELNETLKKQLDHRTIRAFKEQMAVRAMRTARRQDHPGL